MRLQDKQRTPPNRDVKYFGVIDGYGRKWVRKYRICFKPTEVITGPCETRKQAESEVIAAGHQLEGIYSAL